MDLDDFIHKHFDPNRFYDAEEVEYLITEAWRCALEQARNVAMGVKLRAQANLDQLAAKFENY